MDLDLSAEITEIVESEIGCDVNLTTASPSGTVTLRGVFQQIYDPVDIGDKQWSAYRFLLKGLASDYTNAAQNDTALIAGVTYTIEDKYETDDGWAYMPLSIEN